MVSLQEVQVALASPSVDAVEYCCRVNINLYDSPTCERLATQAAVGRQLQILSLPLDSEGRLYGQAAEARLCEDDYPAWLHLPDLELLDRAEAPYQAVRFDEPEIRSRIPAAIAFAYAAMEQPNYYLWGGTVGPNYDCSGLVQAAFVSVGIWLPRDAYQQEAFTQAIALEALQPGDLIFFGPPERATHVGIYLGEGYYIHSSGREQGRNGIGIDCLSEQGDPVSQTYYRQLRGAGRVVTCYQSQRGRTP